MKLQRDPRKRYKYQTPAPDSGVTDDLFDYCYDCGEQKLAHEFKYEQATVMDEELSPGPKTSKAVQWLKARFLRRNERKTWTGSETPRRYRCIPPSQGPCPGTTGPSALDDSLLVRSPSPQPLMNYRGMVSMGTVDSIPDPPQPDLDAGQSMPERERMRQEKIKQMNAEWDERVSRALDEIPEDKRLKDFSWKNHSSLGEPPGRIRQVAPMYHTFE
ncbi:hypothetical protein FQN53_006152 [Emmonsiellopsis sp. PD_33]|nr:hypothetical protein FQN53_006152 [Emmonsiellopsis sp. PD_33]